MRRTLPSLVTLSASLISLGCASSFDLVQLAGRSCPPLPPFGRGTSFGSVRVTFNNTAPLHPVVIQLLSVQDRCAHLLSVNPDGSREVVSVPPGEYVLRAVGPGTSVIEPMRFYLGFDIAVAFTLPVVMEDKATLCAALPSCAAVLNRRTSGELTGTEEERMRLIGHRLAIAMAMEAERSRIRWVACVDGGADLISQLREVFEWVAPLGECVRERDPLSIFAAESSAEYLVHAPTGRPARVVEYELLAELSELANIRVSYTGPAAAGRVTQCALRRSAQGWTPEHCWGSDQAWRTPAGAPPLPPPPRSR